MWHNRLQWMAIAAVLICGVGCGTHNSTPPTTAGTAGSTGTASSHTLQSSTGTDEAEVFSSGVIFPEQLPVGLTSSASFKQALASPAVIIYDGEVITTRKAVDAFIGQTVSSLYIYSFYSSRDGFSTTELERTDSVLAPYSMRLANEESLADTPVFGAAQSILSVSLNSYGCLMLEGSAAQQDYRTVISGYELYEDYAQRVAQYKHYLLPIANQQPLNMQWVSADELTDWVFIFEQLFYFQNAGDSPWDVYGERWHVPTMYTLAGAHFNVSKAAFWDSLKPFDYDAATDTIFYEGGRGGYSPRYMVTASRQTGAMLEIDYYQEDFDASPVQEFGTRTLTVQLAEDGSFQYVSNQLVP